MRIEAERLRAPLYINWPTRKANPTKPTLILVRDRFRRDVHHFVRFHAARASLPSQGNQQKQDGEHKQAHKGVTIIWLTIVRPGEAFGKQGGFRVAPPDHDDF